MVFSISTRFQNRIYTVLWNHLIAMNVYINLQLELNETKKVQMGL